MYCILNCYIFIKHRVKNASNLKNVEFDVYLYEFEKKGAKSDKKDRRDRRDRRDLRD
jgi:hypothetical protein